VLLTMVKSDQYWLQHDAPVLGGECVMRTFVPEVKAKAAPRPKTMPAATFNMFGA